ncbi:MAG TPA: helix-turn-helix domain-containing protein [Burkholderiaceae bacterium]
MKLKPWAKMPTAWIKADKLREFRWQEDGSASTAALMLYFVFCQFAYERPLLPTEAQEPPPDPVDKAKAGANTSLTFEPVIPFSRAVEETVKVAVEVDSESVPEVEVEDALVVRLTYTELASLTGLSRERIAAGLKKLVDKKIVWRLGGSGLYGLSGFKSGVRWAKLPGSALTTPGGTSFTPFTHFTLRSRQELNALKLHLYYVYARDTNSPYCVASFETISKHTGVPEREIPAANSLLLSSTILVHIKQQMSDDRKYYGPNLYYLNGYGGLFIEKKSA